MTVLEQWEPGASKVTVWDLEMTASPAPLADSEPPMGARLMTARRPAPELSRFFYSLVGESWHWRARRSWTADQWLEWVDRPAHHLVSCWVDGVPAGYFELEAQPPTTVELAYFGLAPGFIGHGLGRWLLNHAIATAWALPSTERLWLHTCSLDGPHAKANYEARGFTVFGERSEWHRL